MTAIRSLLFHICFYAVTALYLLVCLPFLPIISRRVMWDTVVRSWLRVLNWLLRVICGIRTQISGVENIPEGPLLIGAKHQSAWETLALLGLFHDPVFILKQELLKVPVFGWYLTKLGMIPVDRSAGPSALRDMTRRARAAVDHGRQIVIFPEGTRRAPGAPPDYKTGISFLYASLKVPCLPLALNSGLFWPRRAFTLRPGTIRVEILPAIPANLPRTEFSTRLEHDIETASNRLLNEGLAELGARAPQMPDPI